MTRNLSEAACEIETLEEERRKLSKASDKYRRRAERAKNSKERAVAKATKQAEDAKVTYNVKEKGIITDQTQQIMLDLVEAGVPMSRAPEVFHKVANGVGVTVNGSINERSVRRITKEGYVAANLQLAEELNQTEGYTVSSDGTSHRHVHHGSSHLIYRVPGIDTPVTRTLPIMSGADHTSETQVNWFKEHLQTICDIWKESPRASCIPLMSLARLVVKMWAMGSDHAEDQKRVSRLKEELKKLCQYIVLGEDELLAKTQDEILALVIEKAQGEVERAGGVTEYESLSQEIKDKRAREAYEDICKTLGEDIFNGLTKEQQEQLCLFLWGGCCMHKEDNTSKRGYERMVAWWGEQGLPGPIKLMNKDNAAAASLGADAKKRAEEASSGGGTKIVQLAGALFNHKDDKKGHQDSWRFYAEDKLGYRINFPDASNIRFQSHTTGAGELLVNRELYINFLDVAAHRKDSPGLNHMEANVLAALQDIPTLTELAVLALYGQAMSHPYMRTVRGESLDKINHLELGPLHEEIVAYHAKIIENPDVLISPEATYQTGSFDGQVWERPDVVYAIQALSPKLPHLRGALVAFFKGALEAWKRFAMEFQQDGRIANLSEDQRKRIWIHPTNDVNEGSLGGFRVTMHRCPSMTLHQYNAKVMYANNDTQAYYQSLNAEDRTYLRRKARELDSGGLERKRRREIAQGEEAIAQAKKVKIAERNEKIKKVNDILDAVVVRLDVAELKASPGTNKELDLQLDWHRRHEQQREADKNKRCIPAKSKLTTKAQKLDALIDAVNRYNALPDEQKAQNQPGNDDAQTSNTTHLLQVPSLGSGSGVPIKLVSSCGHGADTFDSDDEE
ncbi:hypothetical protein K474DRAFT_1650010 [Panus rudis PR-1116 ss-1]|nr:hypothetical protein K474DRAFT_1650010 [Panus rudis PR-1116 ss-1]